LQEIISPIQLSGTVGITKGAATNLNLFGSTNRGYVVAFTNGYWTNGTLDSPKTTNLVNHGDAISSPGNGTSSEQFGAAAHARNDYDTAFGASTLATNGNSSALGYSATAFAGGSAVGALSTANTNSAAVGYGARAAGIENVVIGPNSDDDGFANIILLGDSITPTADNQVIIGGSSQTVTIGGPIVSATASNTTIRGTTTINGRIDLTSGARTTLANGYNSGTVLGTNAYIRLSGASAACTNAGFAAGVDGTLYVLQVDNPGLSYTLLNESGLEATAANRILTGTGALANSTNNPVMLGLIYDGTSSRYRLLYLR